MDIEDKELFDSATDVATETVETPTEQPEQQIDQPRDDQGRYAPKAQDAPEPQAAPEAQPQAQQEANVPSWRLREVREEADRRVAETESRWQRQYEMLQRQNQPKPEPQKPPEVWENPDGFVDHKLGQAVDPIKAEVQETRNFYSHRDAVREHGKEKVATAFGALDQAAKSGNRDAQDVCARVHAGLIDPWGEIVSWHDKTSVYQQIGNDPQAWFGKTLDERIAADPKFAGELMQKLQQSARQPGPTGQPQAQGTIKLPPSLTRVPAAQAAADEDNDVSDAGLFRYASR